MKEKDIIEGDSEVVEVSETRALEWPPWAGPNCKAKWDEFKKYRRKEHGKGYKSADTEQKALNLAAKYFKTGQEFVAALDYTMARGWQFPVPPDKHDYPLPEGMKPVWNARA